MSCRAAELARRAVPHMCGRRPLAVPPVRRGRHHALKKYRDTIDCDGDPVQINEIIQCTTDDWNLAGFSDVVLTIGSDEYKLKFDTTSDTPVLANQADVLPLYVGNQDLVIYGTIAAGNLPLGIKYDTIPNASCEQVPHAAYQ